MLERSLVFAPIVECFGISKMQREQMPGFRVPRGPEYCIHALEKLLAFPLRKIDEVAEVRISTVHHMIAAQGIEDMFSGLVEAPHRLECNTVEVKRLRVVRI